MEDDDQENQSIFLKTQVPFGMQAVQVECALHDGHAWVLEYLGGRDQNFIDSVLHVYPLPSSSMDLL